MKLVPAGSFTMGSPRRESGRRANESQRAVELQRRFYVSLREITNAQFRQFRSDHRSGFVGPDDARARAPARRQRELAGRGRLLQLAQPAGRADTGVRVEGRQARRRSSPATNGYRLPTEAEWECDRAQRRRRSAQVPVGRRVAGAAGRGQLRAIAWRSRCVPQFLADYDDGYAVDRAGRQLRGKPARVFSTSAATSPSGPTISTLCSPPAARRRSRSRCRSAKARCT